MDTTNLDYRFQFAVIQTYTGLIYAGCDIRKVDIFVINNLISLLMDEPLEMSLYSIVQKLKEAGWNSNIEDYYLYQKIVQGLESPEEKARITSEAINAGVNLVNSISDFVKLFK